MKLKIVTIDTPTPEHREAVLAPLRAYNVERAGPARLQPFSVLVKDEAGHSLGGIYGHTSYDWMFVQYLAILDECRGQGLGAELMKQAEDLARARDCVGVWLDTYAFQAAGFYERLGYSVFGSIPDHPIGSQRMFFSKRL